MATRRVAVAKEQTPQEELQSVKYDLAAAIKRIEALEANRPGRKAKPLIALRQDGVCAVSPDIDSAGCPDASIFRYQQGCHGTRCKAKQHDAYERRKDAKAAAAQETPVAKPTRKAPIKKTTAKKKTPVSRRLAAVGA